MIAGELLQLLHQGCIVLDFRGGLVHNGPDINLLLPGLFEHREQV